MRYKNYLFFVTVFGLILMLAFFSHYKNSGRSIEKIAIEFELNGALFLSDSLVNKLLIQKKGVLPWKAKDSLVLSMLESFLETNPYVKNAEVYHFQNGILGVSLEEKKAVARIQGPDKFYMDNAGNLIPLSSKYTPKVPVYFGGLEPGQKSDVLALIDYFNADPFLRNELASIYFRSESFFIGLRSYGFEVEIGQIRRMEEKLSKLKVFCAYYDNYKLDKEYSLVNLKYKNQVVGS